MIILLALFNFIMFAGFGFMSMSRAYSFYKEEHLEWIKYQIEEQVKEQEEAEKSKKQAEINAKIEKEKLTLEAFAEYYNPIIYGIQLDKLSDYCYNIYKIIPKPTVEVTGSVSEPTDIRRN